MNNKLKLKNRIYRLFITIFAFFPIRLLIDYLKYNRLIFLMWLFPFLFVSNLVGVKFGLPILFLTPEYLGHVSGIAFLFTGLAAGTFIMAFQISSYVAMAHHYPFLVRTTKPFFVYVINNSIIPLSFIFLFLIQSFKFQYYLELLPINTILINLASFLIGIAFFVLLSFGFFFLVVRGIPKSFSKMKISAKNIRFLKRFTEKSTNKKLEETFNEEKHPLKIKYYLLFMFKIVHAGKYAHYSENQFKKMFFHQHVHALFYVIFVLSFIIIRGLIKDNPILILPAGASFYIIFTVTILVISLLYDIFRKWTVVIIGLLLVAISFFSPFNILSYHNSAYGMNYKHSHKKTIDVYDHGDYHKDSLETIEILNKWKKKNSSAEFPEKKPKMVIITTSGGGLKMAFWTYYVLGYVDSLMQGSLMSHTELITGASGGMFGAAYLRENYLRQIQKKQETCFSRDRLENLSKDILNPIFYSFAMSDWFFRTQQFSYNNRKYFKDRAYIFEQTLNHNLGSILDKPLKAYKKPEQEAKIPLLIMTPSIENVGSRMIISPLNMSYLTKTESQFVRNVEFRHNYAKFDADNLRFLSAIRMNAGFPYVSPDVALPGKPSIYLIDAGLNDNFGLFTAYDFIVQFKTWIEKNTSGVVLIRIDEEKEIDYNYSSNPIGGIFRPLGAVFSDWVYIQEINGLSAIQSLHKLLPGKFNTILFSFDGSTKKISLSWHLTKYEKQILKRSINLPENQQNIKKMQQLLSE